MASAGLMLNNSAVVIASMIIAPFMTPILSFSVGILIPNKNLIKIGFINQILGFIISVVIGFLMGLLSEIFRIAKEPSVQMLIRTFPNWLDVIVAVCAGIAIGFSTTSTLESSLVGIAIAASLMPPAANVGIACGFGDYSLALGSFMLFLMNIVLINLAAIVIFRLKRIKRTTHLAAEWEEIAEESPE